MPLTPEERKKKLGFGGLKKIAGRTRRTLGHVSQVNSRKRTDAVVERAIAREITKKHPEVQAADVWPPEQAVAV